MAGAQKYVIFSVIFFGYGMFAYNRKGVSFTIPKLLEEGLQNDQVGLILSSQNLAYAISKFLGGIISDKLSARILFSSGLFISGLAAVLFSAVDSVPLFTLVWFLNGLAQGVGWPSIAKLLKNWFDPAELGVWWSLASASANLSGCIAPFVASYIIREYGWRSSLTFVGAVTVSAAVVSLLFIVDAPTSTSSQSTGGAGSPTKKGTKKDSATAKASSKQQKQQGSAIVMLLKTKFVLVISVCYLIASCIKTSITDWGQMYLMLDCHQSSLVANSFVSSIEFGGFLGGIAAGYLSDLVLKRTGGVVPARGHPRMTVAFAFAILGGVCQYALLYLVDKTTSAIFINQIGMLLGAAVYGQIAIFGVVATQSVPSEMSGTSHAIAALAANVGSILAGLPFATLARLYSWSQVFLVLTALTALSVSFMLVNRRISYKLESSVEREKKSQ